MTARLRICKRAASQSGALAIFRSRSLNRRRMPSKTRFAGGVRGTLFWRTRGCLPLSLRWSRENCRVWPSAQRIARVIAVRLRNHGKRARLPCRTFVAERRVPRCTDDRRRVRRKRACHCPERWSGCVHSFCGRAVPAVYRLRLFLLQERRRRWSAQNIVRAPSIPGAPALFPELRGV